MSRHRAQSPCERLSYFLAYLASKIPGIKTGGTSASTGLARGKGLDELLAQVLLEDGFSEELRREPVALPASSSHAACSTIASVLTLKECDALVAMTESLGFVSAKIDVKGCQELDVDVRNSGRVMIDSPAFASALFLRVKSLLPAHHTERHGRTWELVGFNERLRFLRYTVDQYFKPHIDGYFQRSSPKGTLHMSFFTFMVYLDTPERGAGGETNFFVGSDAGEVRCLLLAPPPC
jgi:hypothetical protein